MVPKVKAIATETNMAKITDNAFSVLINIPKVKSVLPFNILINERAKAPPSSSKTIETVVEVAFQKKLNVSSRYIVIIKTHKMAMISTK